MRLSREAWVLSMVLGGLFVSKCWQIQSLLNIFLLMIFFMCSRLCTILFSTAFLTPSFLSESSLSYIHPPQSCIHFCRAANSLPFAALWLYFFILLSTFSQRQSDFNSQPILSQTSPSLYSRTLIYSYYLPFNVYPNISFSCLDSTTAQFYYKSAVTQGYFISLVGLYAFLGSLDCAMSCLSLECGCEKLGILSSSA